jgi:hypothetical protein
MTETKPSNIITEKSSQNLLSNPTLADTFIEQIYAGVQVSELLKPNNIYQISLMSFYSQLRKPENKELKERFEEARKIGVQTLVEKLINIYSSTDKIPDPQTIMFLREKTKFLMWLGEKLTDIYGNKGKEMINKGTVNNIVVSWLDSPALEAQYNQYEEINQAKKEIIDQ